MYKISTEDFLRQIAAPHTDAYIQGAEKAFEGFDDTNNIKKHLIQLSDKIKHVDGYIALSGKNPGCFKIKTIANIRPIVEEFIEIVNSWANKYDISLEKEGKKFYLCSR